MLQATRIELLNTLKAGLKEAVSILDKMEADLSKKKEEQTSKAA